MFLIFSIPGRDARRQVSDGRTGKRSHAASCVWKYPIWGCFVARWALFGFAQAPTLFTVEAGTGPATRAGGFDPP